MKATPPRNGKEPKRRHMASPQTGPQREAKVNTWGLRWHAGNFRMALTLMALAAVVLIGFGQNTGALAQWYLRDGFVATRATVVKAPFWADALEAKTDDHTGIAGWHIELRVGDYPFTLPVSLADFDPDKISTDQKRPPDAQRYAVGSVHPVWLYADHRKKQPETVALLNSTPPLLYSRAAFKRFPSLSEAAEDSMELLIAPVLLLCVAEAYLLFSFFGKRGGDTAGPTLVGRLPVVFFIGTIAFITYLVSSEHPLDSSPERYIPAEIEILSGPFPSDKLTIYRDYRVLWRTWQVHARLTGKTTSPVFTIDVDGLDPHRVPWASRHSPDVAALQPGTKLAVWENTYHSATLQNLGSDKPIIYWETFLSRERWPDKYTWRNFVQDNPVAVVLLAGEALLLLIWLMPLGGKVVESKSRRVVDTDN